MSVDATHPEYDKFKERWDLVRAIIDSNAKSFIKDIDPNDPDRSKKYREDAILTNFTSRTKNALVGSVFRKPPEVDLPSELEYLIEDATGSALGLDQFAQEIVGDVLEVGRYGILVDYPTAEDGLTAAEVANLNLAARLYGYRAENIINWYKETVNGLCFLAMVVLKEIISKPGYDGFTWEEQEQYRVLTLVDGHYEQHLYNNKHELIAVFIPKKADGSMYTYIPFVFIGSENNDPKVDNSPMYDLAQLNIGHMKNSADYEESIHVTGQPTLFISSAYSAEEFSSANPNGVKIGARAGHNLGEGGNATMLQAEPNQLADVAMSRKEQQAVMTGARLIMPQSGVETAEAARIRYSSENSVLATLVNNVSDGLLLALQYAAEFMGANPDDIVYKLNTEFYDAHVDPQMLMAQIQLYDRGLLADVDMRATARKAGLIEPDRTDDDIANEVDDITLDVDNDVE